MPVSGGFLSAVENTLYTITVLYKVRAECTGRNYCSLSLRLPTHLFVRHLEPSEESVEINAETSAFFRDIGQTLSDSIEFQELFSMSI